MIAFAIDIDMGLPEEVSAILYQSKKIKSRIKENQFRKKTKIKNKKINGERSEQSLIIKKKKRMNNKRKPV